MDNVLIIGATSAIAQALARQFAQRGTGLVLWGRSAERLGIIAADLRSLYSTPVAIEAFDFDDFTQYATVLDRTLADGARIGTAVICHGSLSDQAACEADFKVAEQELRINCLSALSFLTLFANRFEQQGHGTLVIISSVAGDRGRGSNYVYGTAKAASAPLRRDSGTASSPRASMS